MSDDKNNLAYWFPLIRDAGLPVPKTKILTVPDQVYEFYLEAMDGAVGDDKAVIAWLQDLKREASEFSPLFLRTGHTSDKHSWSSTCYVSELANIESHIWKLIEFSECAGIFGLPWKTIVLREFLPTKPFGVCRAYGNMPVCREFRFFVDGPEIKCWHPYWPKKALEKGVVSYGVDYEKLCAVSETELAQLKNLASMAGKAVGGEWSIDILDTERGWFVTDMAQAKDSFHFPGCSNGDGT